MSPTWGPRKARSPRTRQKEFLRNPPQARIGTGDLAGSTMGSGTYPLERLSTTSLPATTLTTESSHLACMSLSWRRK